MAKFIKDIWFMLTFFTLQLKIKLVQFFSSFFCRVHHVVDHRNKEAIINNIKHMARAPTLGKEIFIHYSQEPTKGDYEKMPKIGITKCKKRIHKKSCVKPKELSPWALHSLYPRFPWHVAPQRGSSAFEVNG